MRGPDDVNTPCSFHVETYHDNGARDERGAFDTVDAARSMARTRPHSSIEIRDAIGWVLHCDHYMPKHPVPPAR